MASIAEIEKSKHEFLEILTLITGDRMVAERYLHGISLFAKNFSYDLPRYCPRRSKEGWVDDLTIIFGQEGDEIGIILKPNSVSVAVPSTKTFIEQGGG